MSTTNDYEGIERDLEAAFAVPVPTLRFEPPATFFTPAPRHRPPGWTLAVAGFVATAAILGAVLVGLDFGGGTKTASAAALIQRSIAASEALATSPTNYHMISVGRGAGGETTSETWVGGTDRYRVESVTRLDTGEARVDGTAMSNGEMWLWQGPVSAPVVAHGPATVSVQAAPRPISIAQHLEGWNGNKCFKAEVTGTEQVAGRQAHVITVVATPKSCPFEPKPLRLATILIDVETDLPLKMVYSSDQPGEGSSFEVTRFETFPSLDDSAFTYTPPAGTKVLEFKDAAELKQLLSNVVVYTVPMGSRVILDALPQPGSEPAVTASAP